ncbi:asparagine synthase (glutamine-hydrolyzing) [Fuerstiella marisgermanici]|nr:asparagine synthase (glutamine-hydrolyzing) [Fuerstiella marisgermanici]
MCGLAGIVSPSLPRQSCEAKCREMLSLLRHRGPDDEGFLSDSENGASMAHARLSIQDLSSAGRQPMYSDDARYVICFNGEIYNFHKLREGLLKTGESFHTGTDTEVILKLYQRHGADVVSYLEGMFAIAVWDTVEGQLFLARDPLGIKPLYVWEVGNSIAFASEIRAVLAADLGPRNLNKDALFDYLRLGSVQEPDTLVEGIWLLPPGSTMAWKGGNSSQSQYWELHSRFANKPDIGDTAEAISVTRAALESTVEKHFVSDVPVGIFLSGGIDSTALVALASTMGHDSPETFCISFNEKNFNEGSLAEKTAIHFGSQHTDYRMTPVAGAKLVETYLESMDQPCIDGFNTFCVSRVAKEAGVKVVLSGLGGDELFGGYPSFQKVPALARLHRLSRYMPARRALGRLVERHGSTSQVRRLGSFLQTAGGVAEAWTTMRGFFTQNESIGVARWLTQQKDVRCVRALRFDTPHFQLDELAHVSALETIGYMRNQLLRESDVMSMAAGLELRVPFVDRAFVDSINRIPSNIRLQKGKQLLLDAVPEIPSWIRESPKRGFRFPFGEWAQGAWSDTFGDIHADCPVPCDTWYRLWTIFALRHFLRVNKVDCSGVNHSLLKAA